MNTQLARLLVFVSSASVLIIEILAVRLLAPYLGVSLEVFTGVIGVILAGISLGAWLGGRAADRYEPTRLLGPLFVAGGITAVISPLVIDLVGPALSTGPMSIVIAAGVGFLPSALLLSAIPPIIVKIQLRSLSNTGATVGSYSAIGTAGAILGSFLTGFVLIAAFPTRPIMIILGVALVLIGIALWVGASGLARVGAVTVVLGAGGLLLVFDGPCDQETTYHCAIVAVDEDRESGRTLILDRIRNSYVDLDDPTYLEFRYIKLFADIIDVEAEDGPLNVLSIGGGGFTMPGYLNATRPGTNNVVLEIDRELVTIGTNELGLTGETSVLVDDARITTRDQPSGWADVVIGDAFSGASVPWHLTTKEYLEDVERVMADDGLYLMNVIDRGEKDFARAAIRTVSEVFETVALYAPPSYVGGEDGGNFVIAAANRPLDPSGVVSLIKARGSPEVAVTDVWLDSFVDGAIVLVDDFAPVDQMLRNLG